MSLLGCGDSGGSAQARESAQSVDLAGRLIQAGRQQNVVSEDEAEQLFGGLETQLKKLQEELNGLSETDSSRLLELTSELENVSAQLLTIYQESVLEKPQALQERLAKAEKRLTEAASATEQISQAAPLLMLGMLQAYHARHERDVLQMQKARVQSLYAEILNLVSRLTSEQIYGGQLPLRYPADRITEQLSGHVDAPVDGSKSFSSLTSRLEYVTGQVQALEQEQQKVTQFLQQNREIATQKQKQYLDLLQQARKADKQDAHRLRLEAYAIKGFGESTDSLIAYEAAVESTQNELQRVTTLLELARLEKTQLEQQIANVSTSIEAVRNNPILPALQISATESRQSAQEIQTELLGRLERLSALEKEYYTARKTAVDYYRKAEKAYQDAERASRSQRETAQYAAKISAVVRRELANPDFNESDVSTYVSQPAGLWQEEAGFYDRLAHLMQIVSSVNGLEQSAGDLLRDYQGKAEQARQSIDQQLSGPSSPPQT